MEFAREVLQKPMHDRACLSSVIEALLEAGDLEEPAEFAGLLGVGATVPGVVD